MEYQGVKEFHLLARLGCYSKMMVFSPFNLDYPSKGNKWCPFQFLKNTPKMHYEGHIPIITQPSGACYG